ncbi:AmpG family muropeptide MFS transporter [Massilia sp. GCM10020059]|uniref:AmpG family muropeptide MFS transporter n=1 Tax=Massilia agrisoli TaxID=2892444 RepID=A0ABS8IRS7_9BURK|nr:AmpG family muropeptide MFS transporter [Massilia agrisoli]MCC6070423.1 AmpG family muropeptide MFS transporter [Massilia agrisoli]
MQNAQVRNPWAWIPTLYFGQAIPYVVVMTLSVTMYKNLGISNADIALYTSWLYLPWVIKPLWSPFVDMFRTKRWWVVGLQGLIAASLALVAFTIEMPSFFQVSLAVLWLMAFSSATHDIAADGFYMLGLKQHEQAAFVGVRSTFYRLANIAGQGLLVYLAGELIKSTGDVAYAWSVVFFVLAAMFIALFVYHHFILPRPESDRAVVQGDNYLKEFFATFASFFRRKDIWLILGFILTYRLGESQLIKLVTPFLMDPLEKGGLGLTTSQVGIAYGTVGVTALTLGGLAGGYLISRLGLKRCLWLMVFSVHLPDLVFVYLASEQPQSIYVVSTALAIEQFGYGFGFTAMMLYMIMVSEGAHKTAHYAICTGLMALGMMVPGMFSGRIQEYMGYQNFFIWVCVATIPAFIMAGLVKIDPEFGKKQ